MFGQPLTPSTLPTLLIADDEPVVRSMLLAHPRGPVRQSSVPRTTAIRRSPWRRRRSLTWRSSTYRCPAAVASPPSAASPRLPGHRSVVLSADEFEPLVRQLMIAGAMSYVRKGIAPADLIELLHRAMQARRSLRRPLARRRHRPSSNRSAVTDITTATKQSTAAPHARAREDGMGDSRGVASAANQRRWRSPRRRRTTTGAGDCVWPPSPAGRWCRGRPPGFSQVKATQAAMTAAGAARRAQARRLDARGSIARRAASAA